MEDLSPKKQAARLLFALQKRKVLTTLQIRKDLDILHPAGRIKDLRENGWLIKTVWIKEATDCGKKHKVAKYILIGKAG